MRYEVEVLLQLMTAGTDRMFHSDDLTIPLTRPKLQGLLGAYTDKQSVTSTTLRIGRLRL